MESRCSSSSESLHRHMGWDRKSCCFMNIVKLFIIKLIQSEHWMSSPTLPQDQTLLNLLIIKISSNNIVLITGKLCDMDTSFDMMHMTQIPLQQHISYMSGYHIHMISSNVIQLPWCSNGDTVMKNLHSWTSCLGFQTQPAAAQTCRGFLRHVRQNSLSSHHLPWHHLLSVYKLRGLIISKMYSLV